MDFAEKLAQNLSEKPELSDDELKILQNLAADLDGLKFSRDENLTDQPFEISLNLTKTKKVLQRGNAKFLEFSTEDFENLKSDEKFRGISKETLQKIWNREVEKAKENPRDKGDIFEKDFDPWRNERSTISIPFDENGNEILPTHEIPAGEIEIVFGKHFSFFDVPDLILQIQNLRNKFYKNPQNVEPEKQEFFEKLGKAEVLFLKISENLAEKYENRARQIRSMLGNPKWNASNETTKDARKIWSTRMFWNFCLAEKFKNPHKKIYETQNGKKVFVKKMTEEFELNFLRKPVSFSTGKLAIEKKSVNSESFFLKKRIFQKKLAEKLSPEFSRATVNLKKNREKINNESGVFSREAAEYFSAFEWNLSEVRDFLAKTKKEILLLKFSNNQKNELFQILKNVEIDPQKINPKYLKKLVFGICEKLDQKIAGANLSKICKNNRAELEIAENKFYENAKQNLTNEVFGAVQNTGEKELLRASEFSKKLAENFAGEKFEKIQEIYRKKFGNHLNLGNFKNPFLSISHAQNQLKTAREKNDQKTETEILKNVFRVTNILIFSQKIIPYKWISISFNKMAESGTGNCMLAQSVAPHIFLRDFFGVETKQISTFEHSILGAVLIGNRIWNFQKNKITDLENKNKIQVSEETGEWFLVQNFDRGNIAASLNWQKFDFKKTADKIKVLQNAVALSPQDPDLRNNLGFYFWDFANENPTERKKYLDLAEAEFLKAAELTRGVHAKYLFDLFDFYKNDRPQPEEAEKVKKQILELAKNEKNVTVAAARRKYSEFEGDIFGG